MYCVFHSYHSQSLWLIYSITHVLTLPAVELEQYIHCMYDIWREWTENRTPKESFHSRSLLLIGATSYYFRYQLRYVSWRGTTTYVLVVCDGKRKKMRGGASAQARPVAGCWFTHCFITNDFKQSRVWSMHQWLCSSRNSSTSLHEMLHTPIPLSILPVGRGGILFAEFPS